MTILVSQGEGELYINEEQSEELDINEEQSEELDIRK